MPKMPLWKFVPLSLGRAAGGASRRTRATGNLDTILKPALTQRSAGLGGGVLSYYA